MKSLKTVTVTLTLGAGVLVGILGAAPSEAATIQRPAAPSDASPLINTVACYPYNAYTIFYNGLGNKCFANRGTWSSLTGFSGITSMCGGANSGYFQWDSSDGRNWVTNFQRNQCTPVLESARIYSVVIR